MYTEGYLIDISEDGSWKEAKVEGDMATQKVIVIRKNITIEDKAGRILKLECQETNELNIGEYYNIFYENNKAKEIYQDKDSINEMQLENNIIGDKTELNFITITVGIILLLGVMVVAGIVLISFPMLLILKQYVLSEAVFNIFINDYHLPIIIFSTIISSILFFIGLNKWEKNEKQTNKKLIEEFSIEIKQLLEEKSNNEKVEKEYKIF